MTKQIDKIMEQAQVFASAWSIVGSRFDGGTAMDDAEVAKNELRQMVTEALAEPQEKYQYGTPLLDAMTGKANEALDKKAENARELGLDYEPAQDSGIVTAGGFDPRTQRTWVGLTDEERDDLLDTYITAEGRARAIEAKLKEKNT